MDPLLFFAALLGLAIGSFWNVLISRLPDPNRGLFRPATSACPACGHAIRPWENLPVLSYILLRGRCSGCDQPIGWVYPMVELAGATILVTCYLLWGLTPTALGSAVFLFMLLGIAVTDTQTYLIPDFYTLGGYLAGVGIAYLIGGFDLAIIRALDGLAIAILLYAMAWLIGKALGRDSLGFGDVLMVGMIASFLGFGQAAVAIFYGAVSGILLAFWHRDHEERHIPFGLHLAIGATAALFIGPITHALILNSFLPWYA